jgi:hypothetical protein
MGRERGKKVDFDWLIYNNRSVLAVQCIVHFSRSLLTGLMSSQVT